MALLWVLNEASQGGVGVSVEERWEWSGHQVTVEEGEVGWPGLDLVGWDVVAAITFIIRCVSIIYLG